MSDFIQLNRTFRKLDTSKDQTDEAYRISLAFGHEKAKLWADIIETPRVIILAEAGAGKTEEFECAAQNMLDAGKAAFFFRLEHLSDNLKTAFEIGSFSGFKAWKEGGDMGYFFLDSVDEAKLIDAFQFEKAIRLFAAEIEQRNFHRIKVFISSRVTRWLPKSDLAFIQKHLPFYEEDIVDQEDKGDFDDIFNENSNVATDGTVVKPINLVLGTPLVVGMQGLDGEQMKTYAVAKGLDVVNADKMIAEIYLLEVADLASRPKDLDDIIGFWKTDNRVGTRLDLIERSFKNRVCEDDPKRKEKDPLTFIRAQEGARKLASAVTLQQINRILVPGADPITEGVDAEQILMDWSAHEIQALLQRPLFEEQTYGTVRFYHRSVREFLTAEWLNNLLKSDKSRRDIEAIFFRKQHGLDVVVPTSRPVLSWMVLLDDLIKEKTRKISPEVFIKSGDVSRLPLEDRKTLLSQLCDILATKGFGRTYFTYTELYRFGKADMSDHIRTLIGKYKDHDEVLDILLVMALKRRLNVGVVVATTVAKDQNRSPHTRVNAIEYLQNQNSKSALMNVSNGILEDGSEQEQRVLSQIIEFYADASLSIINLVSLLARFQPKSDYSYDRSYDCGLIIVNNFTEDQCFEFLEALYPLLKSEPLLEKKYLEISQQYKWLYTPALKALEVLVKTKDGRVFDPRLIELLSFSIRSHDFRDADDYKANFDAIVPQFLPLNDALFWYSMETARADGEEVKRYRAGHFWRRNWLLGNTDFDRVLSWVAQRDFIDDKLVALSMAFEIYVLNGRLAKRRRQLWKVVEGNQTLHDRLYEYLHPAPMGADDRKWRRQESRWKVEDKKRTANEVANRKKWQKWLYSPKAEVLLDISIATEGKMWNGNSYLMDRVRENRNGSDKLARKSWRSLIPTYGEKVAERYRDAAIAYWRYWTPTETINSNRTTNATMFGLTGLAIEAIHNPNWLNSLSEDEARLAVKYAHQEMNGYPDWFEEMFAKFPQIILADVCDDIESEFKHRKADAQYFGCLHKITWRYPWIYSALTPHLIEFLEKYEPKHQSTLLYSLGIVLQCREIEPIIVVTLIKKALNNTNDIHRQAIWYSAWMNVSADDGLKAVISFVDTLNDEDKTSFVMSWITMILGDRHETLRSEFRDFKKVKVLKEMYLFVYKHIRAAEDINRAGTGGYSPNLRDDAQSARGAIFNILSQIPGRQTFDAFLEFSKIHPEEEHRPWYIHHARERAENDADSTPWRADDFTEFEKTAKRQPQNHQEVLDLSRSRLLDIKYNLEHGDDSQAIAMIEIDKETIHRSFYVKEFRDKSNGFYTVTPEEELADKKRVDLRIHGSGLDCPVPIELKLAGNWTGDEHFERLENQLVGDYLRDMRSSRGIFLIVNRGKKKKRWDTKDGKRRNFNQLIEALQVHSDTLMEALPHIEEIQVIGIDLTVRVSSK